MNSGDSSRPARIGIYLGRRRGAAAAAGAGRQTDGRAPRLGRTTNKARRIRDVGGTVEWDVFRKLSKARFRGGKRGACELGSERLLRHSGAWPSASHCNIAPTATRLQTHSYDEQKEDHTICKSKQFGLLKIILFAR